MKNTWKKTAPNQRAFSLIELMVVVSIVSLIGAMSIPNYALFKIKASQAEMRQNTRIIATAAHAYHAENGTYLPPAGFASLGPKLAAGDEDPEWYGCTGMNVDNLKVIGFAMTEENCMKLRYEYTLYPTGGFGNATDASRQKYFTVFAVSSHEKITGDPNTEHQGAPPITNMCKRPAGKDLWYRDLWTLYESGVLQPYLNNNVYDAVKNCFN